MKKRVIWGLVIVVAAVGLYFAIPKDPIEAIGGVNRMAVEVLNRDIDLEFNGAIATGDLEHAQDLLDRGANVDAVLREGALQGGMTTLMMAVGYLDGVQFLLDAGADPDLQRYDGATALHLACKRGYVETVRVLLEAGADPSIRTKVGETARSIAEQSGNEELLALFQPSGD